MPSLTLTRWAVANGKLALEWKDKTITRFPLAWLLDHQHSNWHVSTNQKINPASALTEDLLDSYRVTDVGLDDKKQEIKVYWSENRPPSSLSVKDLRHRSTLHSRWGLPAKKPWKTLPDVIPQSSATMPTDKSAAKILSDLAIHGLHLVTDMPSTVKETEEFVRSRLGPPRETFYGGMWDTAPRTDQINDTAYTYDALDPHTDTCYLMDSPGLQLFNCVAQDSGTGGRTRLVDADMVVNVLQTSYPETYKFFCEKPLVFHHTEKGLFARVCAPVIALEVDGGLKQFRYNEYDLAIF
jgi:trimethyllysine dioxygenase